MVFVFHGHTQKAQDMVARFALHAHWPQAIVVYMQGLPRRENDGPGWQYDPDDEGGRDLKFFDAALASLKHDDKVDGRRVYAAGFSNGAGFAFVLWNVRADRVAAVATVAMHAGHNLRQLTPRPMFHVAGKKDDRIKFESQMHTVEVVRQTNECGEGRPYSNTRRCTIYPSKIGAPVVTMIHDGGHMVPQEVLPFIAKFFKEEPAAATPANRRGDPKK